MTVLAFTQVNAQNVEAVYSIKSVSVAYKEGDARGEFEKQNVNHLVSNELIYNKSVNAFLMPTINSGFIPVMVEELIEEVEIETGLITNFKSNYSFNDQISDCNIYILLSNEEKLVFFFDTDDIIIAYEIDLEGIRPAGRNY